MSPFSLKRYILVEMLWPVLRTPRLELRPARAADVDDLHRLWVDAEVRRYLWDDQVISREQAAEVVAAGESNFRERGFGLWCVREPAVPTLAGFCGLREAEAEEIEILYGLAPAYWGRGLAVEAARAVLGYGFRLLALARIVGRTDPPNLRSVHVLERLGMLPDPQAPKGLVGFVARQGEVGGDFEIAWLADD